MYTILDVADNQRLQTLDMTYQRVPMLCDESPSERVGVHEPKYTRST